jgi:hypothetical protein
VGPMRTTRHMIDSLTIRSVGDGSAWGGAYAHH